MLPKISIVTPSYNQGEFIEETICSVLDQNYPNLEYIIIDGGSTDQSVDIIKKYEKHLHYWVSEKDRGQAHAINKGFERCSGEVFNWLNSDDFLTPGSLALIGDYFANEELQVLCARENRINHKGDFVKLSNGTTILNDLTSTFARFHIDQPSTYFRRDRLKTIFPVNELCHFLMDAEFWKRYLAKYGLENIQQIDTPIVNFRLHDDSKTVSQKQNFQLDKNAIENGFLRSLNANSNDQITPILLDREQSIAYDYPGIMPSIDETVLLSYYAARSIERFYLDGKYQKARALLKFVLTEKPDLINDNKVLSKVKSNLKLPNAVLKLKHFGSKKS